MASPVTILLLLPFIVLNLLIGQGKIFAKGLAKILIKLGPAEEIADPGLEAYRRKVNLVLNLAKVGAGVLGLLAGLTGFGPKLNLAFITLLLLSAVAFRNGADISRMVIYANHDSTVIRARSKELLLGRLLSRILAVGIILNALFLGIWAVAFVLLKAGVRSAVGLSINQIPIILWGAGIVIGALLAWMIARKEPRFLLRDDLGVGIFSGLVRLHHLGYSAREAVIERLRPPSLWKLGTWPFRKG